jgi:hypothetical protein
VNRKKLAVYLLVGFVVAALLVGGYVLLGSERPIRPIRIFDNNHAENCMPGAQAVCRNSDSGYSWNLSEIKGCQSVPPRSIRNLPYVEDVNESTGVVTCWTSPANTSN